MGEILQSLDHRNHSSSVLGAFRTGIPGSFAALAAGRAGRRCGVLRRFHAFQLGLQLRDLLLQLIRAFLRFGALLFKRRDLFLDRRALLLGLDLFDGLAQFALAGLEAVQLLPQRRQLLFLQIDPSAKHQCFKHWSVPPYSFSAFVPDTRCFAAVFQSCSRFLLSSSRCACRAETFVSS